MTDIAITWNPALNCGDWALVAGDVASGNDLESAVLVSLFSDAVAPPDFVPPDGSKDRRGWWCDTYNGFSLGSKLWMLDRAVKSGSTSLLVQARKYCLEALQWLLDDGIAAAVDATVTWASGTALSISITITQPQGGGTQNFQYSWAWQSIGVSS